MGPVVPAHPQLPRTQMVGTETFFLLLEISSSSSSSDYSVVYCNHTRTSYLWEYFYFGRYALFVLNFREFIYQNSNVMLVLLGIHSSGQPKIEVEPELYYLLSRVRSSQ